MIRMALIRTMDKVAFDQSGSDQGALGGHLHIRKIEKIRLRPDFFWSQTSKYVVLNVLLFEACVTPQLWMQNMALFFTA